MRLERDLPKACEFLGLGKTSLSAEDIERNIDVHRVLATSTTTLSPRTSQTINCLDICNVMIPFATTCLWSPRESCASCSDSNTKLPHVFSTLDTLSSYDDGRTLEVTSSWSHNQGHSIRAHDIVLEASNEYFSDCLHYTLPYSPQSHTVCYLRTESGSY